jgi:hypothetical protein
VGFWSPKQDDGLIGASIDFMVQSKPFVANARDG